MDLVYVQEMMVKGVLNTYEIPHTPSEWTRTTIVEIILESFLSLEESLHDKFLHEWAGRGENITFQNNKIP